MSADGRYVAFWSYATDLVPGDTNGFADVFVHDRQSSITERVSVASDGTQGNSASEYVAVSTDDRYVAFWSLSTNLVPGDTNASPDVFIHDRIATGFASLCDPGVGAVIACPCSNAPSGPGRGCDNSNATGGASLGASGIAYLSMDRLVLVTRYEPPAATSVLLQGNAVAGAGVAFGHGVSCVGGSVLRLFMQQASGGSIAAPQAGDPTVSARSAALGDPIAAGQSRWYVVYYRDPVMLGGCPLSGTFNATQTARIDWSL
jgi:hypothetical protein